MDKLVTQSRIDEPRRKTEELRTRGLSPVGKRRIELENAGVQVRINDGLVTCEKTVQHDTGRGTVTLRVVLKYDEEAFMDHDVAAEMHVEELRQIGKLYVA